MAIRCNRSDIKPFIAVVNVRSLDDLTPILLCGGYLFEIVYVGDDE